MQDPLIPLYAAIIAAFSALIGVIVSSGVNLFVAWINDKRERNKLLFQWSEEKKQRDKELANRDANRIEDYVLKRLSMIQGLSKPLEHRQVLRDLFMSEHTRLVGESFFSRQTLNQWNKDELARYIKEIEELFYEAWGKRMNKENLQDFTEQLNRLEELSSLVLTGLGENASENHYSQRK